MHNQSDAVGRHDGVRLAMRGLVVAPVDLKKPGIRILDSGTGDGRHSVCRSLRGLKCANEDNSPLDSRPVRTVY